MQRLAGGEITVHLRVRLPEPERRKSLKDKLVKSKYIGPGQPVSVLFGLTENQRKKLENEVKRTHSNRSNICRKALDAYRLKINKETVSYQPYHKYPVLGLKNISVTIRQDQADWVRIMAEKTGKKLSEIGREALEYFFEKTTSS